MSNSFFIFLCLRIADQRMLDVLETGTVNFFI